MQNQDSKVPPLLTLRQLCDQLGQLMLTHDQPVMVTKDGVALGFFLPAKVWQTRQQSVLSEQMVELVLTSSGHDPQEVQACVDAGANRRYHPIRLPRCAAEGNAAECGDAARSRTADGRDAAVHSEDDTPRAAAG